MWEQIHDLGIYNNGFSQQNNRVVKSVLQTEVFFWGTTIEENVGGYVTLLVDGCMSGPDVTANCRN